MGCCALYQSRDSSSIGTALAWSNTSASDASAGNTAG
jgi:hypothetical protein